MHALRSEPVAVCDPHREDVEGSDRHGDQTELGRGRMMANGSTKDVRKVQHGA